MGPSSQGTTVSEWQLAVPLSHWLGSQWAPPPSILLYRRSRNLAWEDGVLEALLCHLLCLLAFWLKSLFFASTTCLTIYWPDVWWAQWAWTPWQGSWGAGKLPEDYLLNRRPSRAEDCSGGIKAAALPASSRENPCSLGRQPPPPALGEWEEKFPAIAFCVERWVLKEYWWCSHSMKWSSITPRVSEVRQKRCPVSLAFCHWEVKKTRRKQQRRLRRGQWKTMESWKASLKSAERTYTSQGGRIGGREG